jgi:hypothetical protein
MSAPGQPASVLAVMKHPDDAKLRADGTPFACCTSSLATATLYQLWSGTYS